MKTVTSVILFCAILSSAMVAQTPKTYTWDATNLANLRVKALAKDPSVNTLVNAWLNTANGYVNRTPVSVIDKVAGWEVYFPTNHPVVPNEYVSFSTYYWPVAGHETDGTPWVINENSATGGGINRAMRDKFDYPRLQVMQAIVSTCAKAYWVSNDVKYARSAAAQLRKWFVTPATRMLPQMDHAQFGPFTASYSLGSAYGIIDLMDFHNLINSIELIRNSGEWSAADETAMKQWMYDFTVWLTTNALGIKEGTKINNNNHGIFYDILLLEQYLYLGDNYNGVNYIQKVKDYLLTITTDYRITYLTTGTVNGVAIDGGMWKELTRSNASGYEAMCLNGYAYLSVLAKKVNIDLFHWNYSAPGNHSIREALEWNIPYIENPSSWVWGSSKQNASNLLTSFWISSSYIPSHQALFNNYIVPQIDPVQLEAHEYNLLFPRPLFYSDDFVSNINPALNRTTVRGGVWSTANSELSLASPSVALSNGTPSNICLNTVSVSKDFSAIANIKLTSSGAKDGVGLIYMATCTTGTAENYYYVLLSNNRTESGVYKVKGNGTLSGTVRTKLANITAPITPNVVYNLRVVRSGTITSILLNGTKVAETTDVEFITGKTGFCTQEGTAAILDVRVTKTAANLPPVVTHTTTNQDQLKVVAGGSLLIVADAFDCDGTVAKVEFFNGSTKLGESLTTPYSYNYSNIPKGVSTIKVVATDNQGAQSSAQLVIYTDAIPTAVSNLAINSSIQVYPNPSKGAICFSGIHQDTAQIDIFDATGKMVMQTKVSNNVPLHLDKLENGVLVLAILDDRQVVSRKIVLKRR